MCSRTTRQCALVGALLFLGAMSAVGTGGRVVQAQEPVPPAGENPFPGRFPAPSLDGGTEWLNCSGPISLRDLRGKVVLLDFWTYCCINCMHILPDLKYLEQKYPNELVVIGVHSAKFDNEKDSENIRQAILRYEIEHPVINDSEMVIARKYAFSSWPTLVLIDPEGNFVGRQPGEGTRDLFDQVIGQLVTHHRTKGTLDESPVTFALERHQQPPTPLRYPGKLLADEAGGRLFISDSNNNRIVISSFDGELLDVIGTGQIGAADGGYDVATFDHPQGMELVDEVLYVADTENHLIRRIDLQARQVTTLAGTGEQARVRAAGGLLRQTALNSPWALQHYDGVLYIAMAGPHQIWKHVLESDTVEVFAGSGREDILDGPRESAALAQPSDIVTDGNALFFVDSEGSAVRRISMGRNSRVVTLVGPRDLPRGRSLFEFGDVDGKGEKARLQHPIGLEYHDGSLYVADTYNHKIKHVDLSKREAVTWLGTGERGDGLDPVQLSEPSGLVISGGSLYIADTNNHRLLKVDLNTKATQEFVIQGLQPPVSTAADANQPYTGKRETVSAVSLGAGAPASITVDFQLPFDHKLNALAPVTYELSLNGASEAIDASALDGRKDAEAKELSAVIPLPLTGKPGQAALTVTVYYQYCRDGVGGVCRFATQRWEVPVTVAAEGESRISLIASPD